MVTGATHGIGLETARGIAQTGMTVIAVGRNPEKTQTVIHDLIQSTQNPHIYPMIADLRYLRQTRQLAHDVMAKFDRLDVLINNAGASHPTRELTDEGLEQTFALNYLSQFLLVRELLPMLKQSGTPTRKSRILNVSSLGHYFYKLRYDNLQGEKRYVPMFAYAVTKLEQVIFTHELARRLSAENANVVVNALNPGGVASGFWRNTTGAFNLFAKLVRPFMISPEEGAKTSIYVATSPEIEGVTGKYFDKCKIKTPSKESLNEAHWTKLWQVSEALIDDALSKST